MSKLTHKQWVIVGSLAILVVCMFLFCSKAKADEPKVNTFLTLSARYVDDWGVGGGVTLQDTKSKMMFTLLATYDQYGSYSGTTPYQKNSCSPVIQVPYTYNPSGQMGFEFMLHIPLFPSKK